MTAAVRTLPLALFALWGLATCSANEPPDAPLDLSALFIGNSLTYTNDMPGMLVAIAAGDGVTIHTGSNTTPNTALIDHVIGGDGPAAIQAQHWDFVVMQQGPTTLDVCRDTLLLAVRQLDSTVRKSGGRSAVMMTWPAAADSGQHAFDIVRESFQSAAREVGGTFLPVGEAWRAAWRLNRTLALYGSDLYHPAPLGSYLAALVIYEQLTGRDARRLPARDTVLAGASAAAATIRLLQQAAHAANATYGAGQVKGLPARVTPGTIAC